MPKKIENSKKNQIFTAEFTARFSDCDPQNLLFFARYFDWAHDAIEGALVARNIARDWFSNEKTATPLRHVEADYFAPLSYGKACCGYVHIARVGKTSITFEVHFVSQKTLLCVVRTTHVFVDQKKFKPTAIPAKILKSFSALRV